MKEESPEALGVGVTGLIVSQCRCHWIMMWWGMPLSMQRVNNGSTRQFYACWVGVRLVAVIRVHALLVHTVYFHNDRHWRYTFANKVVAHMILFNSLSKNIVVISLYVDLGWPLDWTQSTLKMAPGVERLWSPAAKPDLACAGSLGFLGSKHANPPLPVQ